jgi:hypothetical protein
MLSSQNFHERLCSLESGLIFYELEAVYPEQNYRRKLNLWVRIADIRLTVKIKCTDKRKHNTKFRYLFRKPFSKSAYQYNFISCLLIAVIC